MFIVGSPFDIKVTSACDPSKVRVSGPGLESGLLATFQSDLLVETRGAGPGRLTVRVRGPRGIFSIVYTSARTHIYQFKQLNPTYVPVFPWGTKIQWRFHGNSVGQLTNNHSPTPFDVSMGWQKPGNSISMGIALVC